MPLIVQRVALAPIAENVYTLKQGSIIAPFAMTSLHPTGNLTKRTVKAPFTNQSLT